MIISHYNIKIVECSVSVAVFYGLVNHGLLELINL